MMRIRRDTRPLFGGAITARLAAIAIVCSAAMFLRFVNPETVSWLAAQKSCGALTGLPCIFCGTTRAVHLLLNGDFARALYFNWLAFPLMAFTAAVTMVLAAEAISRRRLLRVELRVAVTPGVVATIAATLVALWALQVTLALTLHKDELLNHRAPLYELFAQR